MEVLHVITVTHYHTDTDQVIKSTETLDPRAQVLTDWSEFNSTNTYFVIREDGTVTHDSRVSPFKGPGVKVFHDDGFGEHTVVVFDTMEEGQDYFNELFDSMTDVREQVVLYNEEGVIVDEKTGEDNEDLVEDLED